MATTKAKFKKKVLAMLQEYMDEAEHQDGPEYWKQFKTNKEACDDFAIFIKCIGR